MQCWSKDQYHPQSCVITTQTWNFPEPFSATPIGYICTWGFTSKSPRVLPIARPPGQTLRGPQGRPSTLDDEISKPCSLIRSCSALLSSNRWFPLTCNNWDQTQHCSAPYGLHVCNFVSSVNKASTSFRSRCTYAVWISYHSGRTLKVKSSRCVLNAYNEPMRLSFDPK